MSGVGATNMTLAAGAGVLAFVGVAVGGSKLVHALATSNPADTKVDIAGKGVLGVGALGLVGAGIGLRIGGGATLGAALITAGVGTAFGAILANGYYDGHYGGSIRDETSRYMKARDTNGDHQLTISRRISPDEAIKAGDRGFEVIDVYGNPNGFMLNDRYRPIAANADTNGDRITTADELTAQITKFDENGDGRLTSDERSLISTIATFEQR